MKGGGARALVDPVLGLGVSGVVNLRRGVERRLEVLQQASLRGHFVVDQHLVTARQGGGAEWGCC